MIATKYSRHLLDSEVFEDWYMCECAVGPYASNISNLPVQTNVYNGTFIYFVGLQRGIFSEKSLQFELFSGRQLSFRSINFCRSVLKTIFYVYPFTHTRQTRKWICGFSTVCGMYRWELLTKHIWHTKREVYTHTQIHAYIFIRFEDTLGTKNYLLANWQIICPHFK